METSIQDYALAETILRLRTRREMNSRPGAFEQWVNTRFPSMTWDKPFQKLIFNELELVTRGEVDRLILSVPPRHGKTELVTIRYTAWRIETNPHQQYILAAYNSLLADRFSRRIRRIVKQTTALSEDRKSVEEWETRADGHVRAAGVGGGITGMGGWGIVIDDPIKGREMADSPSFRDRLWDWFQDDLWTRREPGAWTIIIQTRWHMDDLVGRILESEDAKDWRVINLPALAMSADDPLGREIGEPLWPERVSKAQIERIRALNERGFWALYQGQPQPDAGAIFFRDWWDGRNRFDPNKAPDPLFRIISVDCAQTMSDTSAYTAVVVLDVVRRDDGTHHAYVREVTRRRVPFHSLLEFIVEVYNSWAADRYGRPIVQEIWIEEEATGRAAIDMIRSQFLANCPVRGYRPRASKDSRQRMAARPCALGRVKFPAKTSGLRWLEPFEKELYEQPVSQFRDMADAFTQALLVPTVRDHIIPEMNDGDEFGEPGSEYER